MAPEQNEFGQKTKYSPIFWVLLNFLVSIKWNGKHLENIRVSEGQEISILKRTIEESGGIPVMKQKLLFKGKVLKVF